MVLCSCLLLPMIGGMRVRTEARSGDNRLEARLGGSVRPCTNRHIDTQSVSSSVIPRSAFPMCADAQTANLLSRKLIRSRSLDESLSTPETYHLLFVPFVLAKDGHSKWRRGDLMPRSIIT
jgi:hypothetical protein